ncbi:MAG: FkbM family methyltransferase [Desulfobacterales bacterium]|nr:MAG: FkbM family methyltransferase [Desulfobacterales bacterium]
MVDTKDNLIFRISYELYVYFILILQGYTLKDKLIIIIYFLTFPFRFLNKLIQKDYDRTFTYNVTIKNKDGLFFCDKSFNTCRIVSRHHERDIEEYFVLQEGDVFIDVGSHAGKYAIRLARQIGNKGQVIAIEPEPYNFEILKRNVELNNFRNIILQNIACSDTNGDIKLYVDDKATTLHSIRKNSDIIGKEINVQTQKIDTLLLNLNIDKVDLIKIDVEGAELEVLKGSINTLQRCHPSIIYEAWNEEYQKKIKKFLVKYNYSIKQINRTNYYAW